MMDLHEAAYVRKMEFRAQARTLELRRQYSEMRKIEKLERALRVARERLVFGSQAPQAG